MSDGNLSPEETSCAELEAEEEEKIKTLLSSASVIIYYDTSYRHDGSLLENATYLPALSRLPSITPETREKPAETCVDLGAPHSVSGSAPYLSDCVALGISRADALSRLKPYKRLFSPSKNLCKSR